MICDDCNDGDHYKCQGCECTCTDRPAADVITTTNGEFRLPTEELRDLVNMHCNRSIHRLVYVVHGVFDSEIGNALEHLDRVILALEEVREKLNELKVEGGPTP